MLLTAVLLTSQKLMVIMKISPQTHLLIGKRNKLINKFPLAKIQQINLSETDTLDFVSNGYLIVPKLKN